MGQPSLPITGGAAVGRWSDHLRRTAAAAARWSPSVPQGTDTDGTVGFPLSPHTCVGTPVRVYAMHMCDIEHRMCVREPGHTHMMQSIVINYLMYQYTRACTMFDYIVFSDS